MKDFLKFTLATIVGIVVSSVLLFFISIMVMFSMLYSSDSEVQVRENSILKLDLKGTLSERSQENPFTMLMGNDYEACGLDDMLASIRKAKENENIKGIYIEASNMTSNGYASLKEIRDALADFKESGKFIVAYADTYTQGLYYVSSVADQVMLNPQGMLQWSGLASTPMFYKDLLEKVGIEMQFFKVGTYKSAIEPATSMKMSDANREQVTDYLTSMWSQITADVSASRGLSVEELNKAADRLLLFQPAEESIKCGLADTLIYKNDVRDYLKQKVGIDKEDDLHMLSLNDMLNVKKNVPKDKSGNIVAVYYADGDIDDTKGKDRIGALRVISDLEALQNDKDVKAVVLRVNSPGGSAFGSEQIWKQVRDLKAEKPVVVSMGGYAASGGYYISCNADYIYAQPTTLTGSIGIFGMVPDGSGLLDKVGISSETVSTNKFGGMMSFDRAMTEEEKALMQRSVNDGYDLFVARCADGRKMLPDDIKKVAEGRVWTGAMAKQLGLVDDLGGLDDAIAKAKELAEVEDCTIITYPAKPSMLDEILSSLPKGYVKTFTPDGAAQVIDGLRWLTELDNINPLQARMPYWVEIN